VKLSFGRQTSEFSFLVPLWRSLDADNYGDVVARARQKVGRVAIANSDAGGDAYALLAIDAAERAVRELLE
jgi:hypothetical protein